MTSLRDLDSAVKAKRQTLNMRIAEATLLAQRGVKLQAEVDRLKTDILTYDKAVLLLNSISEARQGHTQRQIEELVTKGLQAIFGPLYSFHVKQTRHGEFITKAEFVIRSPLAGGHIVETSIMNGQGGGFAAVVGVLLRIILLLLEKKDKSIPLILDESIAHLSSDHMESFCKFLKELVDLTGIQIIMVTHQRDFAMYADKIYEFILNQGVTKVKELSVSDI